MVKISNHNHKNGEYIKELEQARKDVDEILKNVNKKFANNTIKDNDVDTDKDNKQFFKEQVNTINKADKNESGIKIDLSYIEGDKIKQKVKNELNSGSGNKLDQSATKLDKNTPPKSTLKITDDIHSGGNKGNIKNDEAVRNLNRKSESNNEQREQIRKLMIALEEERKLRTKSEKRTRGVRAIALATLVISIIAMAEVAILLLIYYL